VLRDVCLPFAGVSKDDFHYYTLEVAQKLLGESMQPARRLRQAAQADCKHCQEREPENCGFKKCHDNDCCVNN
jgi:hypothetical protein